MKFNFYFSKGERRKLVVWLTIMLLVLAALPIYMMIGFADEKANDANKQVEQEVHTFMAGVHQKEKAYEKSSNEEVVFRPQKFDPNTCDSTTLLNMGLKSWQVGIFLKYRKAGARFYNEEDLKHVYSFTKEDVERMLPYATFPIDERAIKKAEREVEKQKRDSLYQLKKALYPEKMQEGEVLPLNAADTTALKKIPGIGSYYAQKIKRYGERLGGYISVSQLTEVGDLPEGIERWFTLDKVVVRKLRINHMDFKTLLKHPYLNYEQVKAIFNHRQKYGSLTSMQQLSLEVAFTKEDMERLNPYITFE